MIEAYNSANAPINGAAILYLIFFAALFAGCLIWQKSGRRMPRYLPAVIVLGGMFFGGIPLIDSFWVSRMDREQMQVTRGTISKIWDVRTRVRDRDLLSTQKYRSNVVEGFDIGADSFSWTSGRCRSTATLCRRSEMSVHLREGQRVEVIWFTDPTQFNKRRIVKLMAEK